MAALLAAAGLVPVVAEAAWDESGFSMTVRVGGLRIPMKKKRAASRPGAENIPKTLFPWPDMRIPAKNGYTTLCRTARHAKVEALTVRFTAAWPDPAGAAMLYAAAGIALEALASACPGADLWAEADFAADWPRLWFRGAVVLRLFWLCAGAVVFGLGCARDYIEREKGKDK